MSTSLGGLLVLQWKSGVPLQHSFAKQVGEYARKVYLDRGEGVVNDTVKDLEEIDRLRAEVLNSSDASDKQVEELCKYFCILTALEMRFPVSKSKEHVQDLSFVWHDAFMPRKKDKQQNVYFEKAAVLFNIGSLMSQQAIGMDRTTSEGLKLACRRFQDAAGVFAFMREHVSGRTDAPHPLDISPEAARFLEQTMLAQAQECAYQKASQEGKSASLCARLAKQCFLFYQQALQGLKSSPLGTHVDKTWLAHLGAKEALFQAQTELLLARSCREADESDIGPQVSRLRVAHQGLSRCLKEAKGANTFLVDCAQRLLAEAETKLRRAVKENETVYLTKVPEHASLPACQEASVVKASPPPLSRAADDVFVGLVPDASAKAMSRYSALADEVAKDCKDRLAGATDEARVTLRQLDLPELLLATEPSQSKVLASVLPPAVRAEAEAAAGAGGHAAQLASELGGLSAVAGEMLASATRDLDAEAREDEACREEFGESWVAPTSASLTMLLRDKIDAFAMKLRSAAESDARLSGQVKQAAPASLADLAARLPVLEPAMVSLGEANPAGAAAALRKTLVDLESCASERTRIEDSLDDAKRSDNVLPRLMSSREPEDKIFQAQLARYDPLKAEVKANLARQEGLIPKLRADHAAFVQCHAVDDWRLRCQGFASEVRASCEARGRLGKDLEEGVRFYAGLQDAIGALRQQCGDFCVTRQMQRSDLREQLARQRGAAAPVPAQPYPVYPGQGAPRGQAYPPPPATEGGMPLTQGLGGLERQMSGMGMQQAQAQAQAQPSPSGMYAAGAGGAYPGVYGGGYPGAMQGSAYPPPPSGAPMPQVYGAPAASPPPPPPFHPPPPGYPPMQAGEGGVSYGQDLHLPPGETDAQINPLQRR